MENRCIYCGEIVPEGRQICPQCEAEEVNLIINHNPFGKQRPRFAGRAYTPSETKHLEQFIGWQYQIKRCHKFAIGEPLAVELTLYYPKPKTMPKGRIKPTVKPDADNVVKLILDALNGIAWHDDAQITTLSARKLYAEKGYMIIRIRRDYGGEI